MEEGQPQVPPKSESHDQSRDLAGEELDEKRQEVSGVGDDGNGETDDTNVDEKKTEISDNEEEGGLSTKDVQQSMDNIFQLLKIENPHSTTGDSQHIDFNEFTKMLNDPTLAQRNEQDPLTSTEKSVSLGGGSEGPKSDEFVSLAPRSSGDKRSPSTGVEDDSSEIVNAAGAPTPDEHLQLLKEKIPPAESDKVPLLSDLGVTDESIAESLAEQNKAEGEGEEAPWPDIGQPEPEMKVMVVQNEGELKSVSSPALGVHVNGSGGDGSTTAAQGAAAVPWVAMSDGGGGAPPVVGEGASLVVSEELPSVVSEVPPPVASGLVMPSADVAIDIVAVESGEKSHDLPEQSHDQGQPPHQEEQSERDVTPGPPEQEGEGLGQEVGGGTLPTELVSKSKKKARRGARGKAKKPSIGNATLGTAGLVEVIG